MTEIRLKYLCAVEHLWRGSVSLKLSPLSNICVMLNISGGEVSVLNSHLSLISVHLLFYRKELNFRKLERKIDKKEMHLETNIKILEFGSNSISKDQGFPCFCIERKIFSYM